MARNEDRMTQFHECDTRLFLDLPLEEEKQRCYQNFYNDTSNKALAMAICGVCAHENLIKEVSIKSVPMSQLSNDH